MQVMITRQALVISDTIFSRLFTWLIVSIISQLVRKQVDFWTQCHWSPKALDSFAIR